MVSSIYWLCLGIINYLLTVCLLKLRFLREKYFYRFINFLTGPPFSVLFVLNSLTFKRIRISLNFERQSKQQFIYLIIYLFDLLGLVFK